jgi:hypothetical protein
MINASPPRALHSDGIADGIASGLGRTTVNGYAWRSLKAEFTVDCRGFRRTWWICPAPPSKPLVGILGDVDGRIVPVAPRQFDLGQLS